MKIAYVPGRELSYSRTRMFIRGLEQNGVDVRVYGSPSKSFIKRSLAVPFRFFFRKQRDEDVVLIGFFGPHLVLLLKPFLGKKKLVFDAYLSLYDTLVTDRKKMEKRTFLAFLRLWLDKIFLLKAYCFFWDKYPCRRADKVLLDTEQHIEYFVQRFGLPREKFERVLIGADDSLFSPREFPQQKKKKALIIGFHGLFIPLQGVEYIIRAAKLLEREHLEFHLVGSGQTFEGCKKLAEELQLQNVQFLGLKKPEEIPGFIATWDIGLGIFGETPKTQRVIPNKAYEIIAMRKPLITADTPAIRELFTHKKNVYACPAHNPEELAKAISVLVKNMQLRERLAEQGHKLYLEFCTPAQIGKQLLHIAHAVSPDAAYPREIQKK